MVTLLVKRTDSQKKLEGCGGCNFYTFSRNGERATDQGGFPCSDQSRQKWYF